MAERWVRNLDVQVRLAHGRLALKHGQTTTTLDSTEAAVWRAWRPVASADELPAAGLSGPERRALWDRLAELAMIEPGSAAR